MPRRRCYSEGVKDQIWLTGFMATGKTRVARPLAAALDWDALDLDAVIQERAGDTIPNIFARDGEAVFRAAESAAVDEIAGRSRIVVATGGGTVLSEANRARMRARGFIVCLEARPETIAERVRASGEPISERPLLAGGDLLFKIGELKAARQSLYADADFIIQTDELTPDQITHQILQAYRESTAVGTGGTA